MGHDETTSRGFEEARYLSQTESVSGPPKPFTHHIHGTVYSAVNEAELRQAEDRFNRCKRIVVDALVEGGQSRVIAEAIVQDLIDAERAL